MFQLETIWRGHHLIGRSTWTMKLIEVKILYNADYVPQTDTKKNVTQLINWIRGNPDVIRISKTVIPDGGGDDEEQE